MRSNRRLLWAEGSDRVAGAAGDATGLLTGRCNGSTPKRVYRNDIAAL